MRRWPRLSVTGHLDERVDVVRGSERLSQEGEGTGHRALPGSAARGGGSAGWTAPAGSPSRCARAGVAVHVTTTTRIASVAATASASLQPDMNEALLAESATILTSGRSDASGAPSAR